MSEWKVVAEAVEVFPHPNAEKLELCRVGTFQLVIGKGMYRSGDLVVFAPKRSILPPELRNEFRNPETGISYLRGPNSDRVGSIRLRGEESEGVTIDEEVVFRKLGRKPFVGEDLAEVLGITEYIPGKSGTPNEKRDWSKQGSIIAYVHEEVELQRFVRHDCEQFRIFENEFIEGELVFLSEKIHGSQCVVAKDRYGKIAVTSKGRAEKNFVLREYPVPSLWAGKGFFNRLKNFFKWLANKPIGPMNEYWRVARDAGLIDFVNHERFVGQEVMVFGEAIPWQTGYDYGQTKKTVLVFRLVVGTIEEPYGEYEGEIKWVPQLYSGPYDKEKILPLAEGKETVSGKSLHLREGVVLTPAVFRKTAKGVPLIVKILGSKFKINDDDPV